MLQQIAGLGLSAIGSLGASLTTAAFSSTIRGMTYDSNIRNPNVVPTPELILYALVRSPWQDFDDRKNEKLANLLKVNGIRISSPEWKEVRDWLFTPIPLDAVIRQTGPPPEIVPGRAGLNPLNERHWRAFGFHYDDLVRFYPYLWMPFTWRDVVDIEARGIADIHDMEKLWAWAGFGIPVVGQSKKYANLARWLQKPIPGVSDLIHFQVREAFDERVSAKYGYDEEYPKELETWLGKQGLDYRLSEWPNVQGQPPLTWGQIYWRAHWQTPSPTQAYQMLVLCRPDRARRVAADWAKIFPGLGVRAEDLVVTPAEVRDLLKIADYPRFWRDRLMALTYSPMTQRYLQQSRTDLVDDPVPLVERVQDLGFLPTEAQVIAQMIERRAAIARANSGIGLSPKEAVRLYIDGLATRQQVEAAARALGLAPAAANAYVARADVLRNAARTRRALSLLRRAFVRRLIDWRTVVRYTQLLGIDERVVQNFEAEWTIERELTSRRRTAADLLRDWEWGVIGRDQLIDELVALGYTRRDAVRMARQYLARRLDARAQRIMRAARQIEADAERRIAKAEKREREARRLAREARMDLERARKELERRLAEARKEAERVRKAAEEAVRQELGEAGAEEEKGEE
jgi:hypothetical protein